MKTTQTKFFTAPEIFITIIIIIVIAVFGYRLYLIKEENAINQTKLIQTLRPAPTNYISPTITLSSKNPHLISVFVGTTCTMQINAESFSIKDGVLSCFALSHEFHIMGAMHSIVIEEIKPGIETITSVLNQPPQEKKQPQNRNERPQIIN